MRRADHWLLIDLGNTAAKLRLASADRLLGKTRRLPTATLLAPDGASALADALRGWRFERVTMSSVVPAAARTILAAFPNALVISSKLNTGVDLRGYSGVKTLGADRIANAAGALALHGPGPLIVVDFGTAATFNALDARGRFLGGVIAPGVAVVADYLPSKGAQLPPIRLADTVPRAIGRHTRDAMRAGAVLGYRGLVRELLATLRMELVPGPVRAVATGGDATWVASLLPDAFDAVDPDLTLHGLRIIAARQEE